jgi:hypothetical protein
MEKHKGNEGEKEKRKRRGKGKARAGPFACVEIVLSHA